MVNICCNAEGWVCSPAIPRIDFMDDNSSPEQLNQTAGVLTATHEQEQPLFGQADTAAIDILFTYPA